MTLTFDWFLPTSEAGQRVRRRAGTGPGSSWFGIRLHALHAAYRRSGVASDLEIYPHLEKAYWFGEGVLPELRRRGVWAGPAADVADRDRVLADRPGN